MCLLIVLSVPYHRPEVVPAEPDTPVVGKRVGLLCAGTPFMMAVVLMTALSASPPPQVAVNVAADRA